MARVGAEFQLQGPACGGGIRLMSFITEPGETGGRSRLRRFASGQWPRRHGLRRAEPLPDARARQSRRVAGLRATPRRRQKNTAPGEARRSEILCFRTENGATGSRAAQQFDNACERAGGSAIDRALDQERGEGGKEFHEFQLIWDPLWIVPEPGGIPQGFKYLANHWMEFSSIKGVNRWGTSGSRFTTNRSACSP